MKEMATCSAMRLHLLRYMIKIYLAEISGIQVLA